MQSEELQGVREKLRRAKEHVSHVETEIREFFKRDPYDVFFEDDPHTGDCVYKVRIFEDPPLEWSAIIGDAIHNLRSVFDHLAWQLVEAGGGTPGPDTRFPIAEDDTRFRGRLLRHMKGASPKALWLVERLKPYKGGNKLLHRLARLDNFDKHRLLLVVGAANPQGVYVMRLRPDGKNLMPTVPSFSFGSLFPLKNNATLMTVNLGKRGHPNTPVHQNFHFTFDIAFSDGEVVKGQSVITLLQQFVYFTERVIQIFERRIFS